MQQLLPLKADFKQMFQEKQMLHYKNIIYSNKMTAVQCRQEITESVRGKKHIKVSFHGTVEYDIDNRQ